MERLACVETPMSNPPSRRPSSIQRGILRSRNDSKTSLSSHVSPLSSLTHIFRLIKFVALIVTMSVVGRMACDGGVGVKVTVDASGNEVTVVGNLYGNAVPSSTVSWC